MMRRFIPITFLSTISAFAPHFSPKAAFSFGMAGLMRPSRASAGWSEGGRTTKRSLFGSLFSVDLPEDGGADYYPVLDDFCQEAANLALENKTQPEVSEGVGKGKLHVATFASGCFWGLELFFQRVEGVEETSVGYTQGTQTKPTYKSTCTGGTGHTEAVQVLFDPSVVSYETLVDLFFTRCDPRDAYGGGNDRGSQYRAGVYTHSDAQMEAAKKVFAELEAKYGEGAVVTELKPAMPYWPAEKYHQQYLAKGGRFGAPQSADKGCTETIRCYG